MNIFDERMFLMTFYSFFFFLSRISATKSKHEYQDLLSCFIGKILDFFRIIFVDSGITHFCKHQFFLMLPKLHQDVNLAQKT